MARNKLFTYAIIAIIAAIVVIAIWPAKEENALNINLKDHNSITYHIHPHLEITINGQKMVIPSDIGITDAGMRAIHTHDTSGSFHIEAPEPHQFYLKDLFAVWGKELNETCFLGYCEDATHEWKMQANGVPSELWGEFPLHDKDHIELFYQEVSP